MQFLRKVLVFAAAASMPGLPVAAHHGWAGQGNDLTELQGTVHQAVNLVNPHAGFQVMADGKVWDITLAPPSRTQGAGLEASTLKVGDQVTVTGNRNKDADRHEIKAVRVSAGGRHYDLYPERLR